MKYVISDSSSLILLAKAEILNKFLEGKKIYITEIVELEAIEKGKEKGKADAYLLEKLKSDGKIKVKKPSKEKLNKISEWFNLYKGEKEAVSLALELELPLICDDKKAFNACEVMNIKHTTALNVLFALFKKRKISKAKAKSSLKKLEEFGWYDQELIQKTKSKIGD